MEYTNLDFNYNASLLLALSLGFDKVDVVNDNYVFSCYEYLPTLKTSRVVLVERAPQTINFRSRARRSLSSFSSPALLDVSTPPALRKVWENQEIIYNENSPLVPFTLTLPSPENASKAKILKGFKNFFNEIVDTVNNKTIPRCNTINLSRLYSTAICFLKSSSISKTNNIYNNLYNAFIGVNYNSKNYLGSIRYLNNLNASLNGEEQYLKTQIFNNINKIYTSSVLSYVLHNYMKNELQILFNNMNEFETADMTENLNQNLPLIASPVAALKEGFNNLVDIINDFCESPKKRK